MYPHLPGPSWATPYGVMLVLALAAAWMWARRRASSAGMDASYIDLLVPLALIVGSLGLRLFGVLLPEDTLVLGPGQRLPFRRQMFGLLLATLPVVLVYALDRGGIEHDLKLAELIDTAGWLEGRLGKALPSALLKAGPFEVEDAGASA